jgi:nicotinamide riboside kinase
MREVTIIPWQLKANSMCVGFSGSSGTGKTTLIQGVSEYVRYPVVNEGFYDYLKEARVDPDHHNWDPKVRMKIQMDLLTRKKAMENSHTQFLADRTTIDMASITMAYLSKFPEYQRGVMDYTNECLIHAQQSYDLIFMLPHGIIGEPDPDRYAWLAMEQILTEHLTALGQPTFHVHQIQSESLTDRVAECLEIIDSISTSKAKFHAEQQGNKMADPPSSTQ